MGTSRPFKFWGRLGVLATATTVRRVPRSRPHIAVAIIHLQCLSAGSLVPFQTWQLPTTTTVKNHYRQSRILCRLQSCLAVPFSVLGLHGEVRVCLAGDVTIFPNGMPTDPRRQSIC